MKSRFDFFKQSIKSYKTSGTILPSSRFLVERMIKKMDFSKSVVIAELGPGNGVITRRILEKLPEKSTLICFEINETFYRELQEIKDPQLVLLKESAEKISENLQKLGFSKVDYIVSSLPLSILPKDVSENILKNCHQALSPNGVFTQYQYSLWHYKKLKKIFKKAVSVDFEPLNVPMAFVYRCKKV